MADYSIKSLSVGKIYMGDMCNLDSSQLIHNKLYFSDCIGDTWMEFRRGTISLRGSSFVYPAE